MLKTEQIAETEANNEEEIAEKAPAILHISKDWTTPTSSVHPGTLPSLSTVTPYTPHHIPASNRTNHPGQPVLDLSSNKDDDDSSDYFYSALDPLYDEARITHDPVLHIHQNLPNVHIKDDECAGQILGSFTESTLSQAIKPEVSTDSVNALDTSPPMTSAHVFPFHPT